MWLPNTYYLFGNSGLKKYNLTDTRMLQMETRLMITLNHLNPNCFAVSKVLDMFPQGIIKFTLKQDAFDKKLDNAEQLICNYYTDDGDVKINMPPDDLSDGHTSRIYKLILNDQSEWEEDLQNESKITLGEVQYYRADFSDQSIAAQWCVSLIDVNDEVDNELRDKLQGMIVIRQIDSMTISLRAAKSEKIIGRVFSLNVSDSKGDYSSAVEIEVVR